MNLHWLLRMSQWARHPPPMHRVILVVVVVALCTALFLVERYIGWPDALSVAPGNWRRP